jgi:Peptidase MA superfamily
MTTGSRLARRMSGAGRRLFVHLLAGGLIAGLVAFGGALQPVGVSAAGPFGTPSASATFGDGVTFDQPFTSFAGIRRIEVLIRAPGALGPVAIEVATPACCGTTTLSYTLAESDGHLVPNTRFTARWRVTAGDGSQTLGPETSILYSDTRFDWQTVTGRIVRLHWYQGSTAFGQRALAIGDKGIDDAARLLGVTETRPVDFFVYADQSAFYDALGPGTRENVGGEAHADIRTMFALITPDEIDATWVSTVVPHELTHLVFDTAVKNPYHFPPRWLNEGLAVYLSEGYTDSWRSAVTTAVSSDDIIPLDGLSGQFPTTRDQFFLAYGESVSAVDFIVRTFGKDALVKLVRSYADGVTDDETFTSALGQDVASFQASWLADLGASAPTALGPQPGPAGPVPAGWAPEPGATTAPNPPLGPAAGSSGPSQPASPGPPTGGDGMSLAIFVAIGSLAVVVGLFLARRSRRRPPGPMS